MYTQLEEHTYYEAGELKAEFPRAFDKAHDDFTMNDPIDYSGEFKELENMLDEIDYKVTDYNIDCCNGCHIKVETKTWDSPADDWCVTGFMPAMTEAGLWTGCALKDCYDVAVEVTFGPWCQRVHALWAAADAAEGAYKAAEDDKALEAAWADAEDAADKATQEFGEAFDKFVTDELIVAFSDQIEGDLDYRQSDEFFIEESNCNEWKYDDSGKLYTALPPKAAAWAAA